MKHTISLLLLLGIQSVLLAHGSIHELIIKISKQIELEPRNAKLYLQRGEYYRIDQDFDPAYADFCFAERLDSSLNTQVSFHLAQLFSEHSYPQSAMIYINQHLAAEPQNVRAYIIRAGINKQLGQDSLAVADFEQALGYAKEPRPFHYLEIAQATLRTDSTDYEGARYWIAKGEERLGFNIALRAYAIEIDRIEGDWDAAIAKVDDIISRLPRHEKWLLARAQLLEQANRIPEAITYYQKTIEAIEVLPRHLQATRAVVEWQAISLTRLRKLQLSQD
ncbi:MAG: hypothetical protein AAFQ68_15550 [Bacteroidota bacterium]